MHPYPKHMLLTGDGRVPCLYDFFDNHYGSQHYDQRGGGYGDGSLANYSNGYGNGGASIIPVVGFFIHQQEET
jgi:hypothetical protein